MKVKTTNRRLKSTSSSYCHSLRYGSCWYSFVYFIEYIVTVDATLRKMYDYVWVTGCCVYCFVHTISTLKSNLFCNPSKYLRVVENFLCNILCLQGLCIIQINKFFFSFRSKAKCLHARIWFSVLELDAGFKCFCNVKLEIMNLVSLTAREMPIAFEMFMK